MITKMSGNTSRHKKFNQNPLLSELSIMSLLRSHRYASEQPTHSQVSAASDMAPFDRMATASHFISKSVRHVFVTAGLCSVLVSMPFITSLASPSTAYAAPASVEAAYDELHGIEEEINDTSQKIEDAKFEISSLNDQIAQLDEQIAGGQQQVDAMRGQLGTLMSTSYKDNGNVLDVIIGCDSLDDLVSQVYALDRAANQKADAIAKIDETNAQLGQQRADADAKRSELLQKQETLEQSSQELSEHQDALVEAYPQLQNSVEYGTSLDTETMIARAYSIIGSGYLYSGYVWTGDTSTSAFTCSGVIDFALGLPTNSNSCYSLRDKVAYFTSDRSQLKRGDVIFYDIIHVALYIGNGKVIDSIPNGGVQVRDIDFSGNAIGGGPLV